MTDHEAMLAIQELMSGNEWNADTLEDIAGILNDAGYAINEPGEGMCCPDCEMVSINGVPCHERGCPNAGARWDEDSGEWVKQRKCFECGCAVDRNDPCCSAPMEDG